MKLTLLEELPLRIQRPMIYHCESDWKWQPTPLPDFDIWLVLAGRGGLEMGGEKQALVTGVSVLYQPGDAPRCWHDPSDPLIVFGCHFDAANTERVSVGMLRAQVGELDFLRRSAELAVRYHEAGAAGKTLAASLVAQIVACFIFALEHGSSDRSTSLEKLASEIRVHPGRTWRIGQMARDSGMSVSHFNRRFRQVFGCAPAHFVIRQRVRRAAGLLRESGLSIQQVADALGYNDVFFFHRQFHRVAGITPRAAQRGAVSPVERS